jgi:hypothetical protein
VGSLESDNDSMANEIGRLQGRDVHVRTSTYRAMRECEKYGSFIPRMVTGERFKGGMPKFDSLTDHEAEQFFGPGQTVMSVGDTERLAHALFLDKMHAWLDDPKNATANEESAVVYMQSLFSK